jgi:hypothetical protein
VKLIAYSANASHGFMISLSLSLSLSLSKYRLGSHVRLRLWPSGRQKAHCIPPTDHPAPRPLDQGNSI